MDLSVDAASDCDDLRVLIATPQGRDAALAAETLARSGLETRICDDLKALRREIDRGAGCVLIAEEALPTERADLEDGWLRPEPSWSSLPVVVLLGRSASLRKIPALRALEARPNVNFLVRPVPKRTLVSALRAAVEARRLQYSVRDALEELRTVNRKKDEFLAILSHELRNPLAPIRNAVYILKTLERDGAGGSDKASALVSMVERQVDHLVRLVDDLMEISRFATGKIVLQKRRENLADILRQALEISDPLIKAGGHVLTVCPSEAPLIVDGDPVRLAQVFANLLNNAAKYTPAGGDIRVSMRAEGDEAVIDVTDNGMGILPAVLPKLFELFSQSHRVADIAQGGIGIGLALSRNLVTLHGGTVEAHSDGPDRGSSFIVRLPLAERREEAARAAPAPKDATDVKALVVDDDRDVADSFALLLTTMGVESRVAYGGQEALGALSEFRPNLVFLDLGMPEMDGYETARQILATPGGKDAMLIALSGWGQSEDRDRTREAGFSHHFVKPISRDALRQVVGC
ncbi:ATP-binding protein [Methylocystis parvus]|uniref:ATP-binding protein n=1 Tax=Methylocystis parvus TaxID=134 RepID=UPI003C71F969